MKVGKNDRNKLPYLPITTLIAVALTILWTFYGKILHSPNDFLFSDSGDGIKNYFTYAYHIKHDSSFFEFEGMNYPYGENHLYTDCHPLLSNNLKYLASHFPVIETGTVGILNMLMLLSILITFIVVFYLLIEFDIKPWIAVLFCITITLLAPQAFRLSNHLALSYSFAIPISWLILMKWLHTKRSIFLIFLFFILLCWMLIHAYLGIIVSAFLFLILSANTLLSEDLLDQAKKMLAPSLAVILPVILFYMIITLTDEHIGRTKNPSGFFLYNAEIDDLLIPPMEPFRPFFNYIAGGKVNLEWEARAYMGLFNSILFIALLFGTIASIFNKRLQILGKSLFDLPSLRISLIGAFFTLMFAFGLPFKLYPDLLEWLPIIKQFRATGRFAWPFYFAFSIFIAYIFNTAILLARSQKWQIVLRIVLVLYLLTHTIEGLYYHNEIAGSITRSPNLFDRKHLSQDLNRSIDIAELQNFQALISLPFYYYGSESYARPRQDPALRNSLVFSYHTGIPNICASLTRTSIEESKNIIQLVTPNYYIKPIVDDIDTTRPFLILTTGKKYTLYESQILERAELLYEGDQTSLYSISASNLFMNDSKRIISKYSINRNTLLEQNSFRVTEKGKVLYFDDFDAHPSSVSYCGPGSYSSDKRGKNIFAEFPPSYFEEEKEYDLSVWMYNAAPDALNLWFRLIVEEYDSDTDQWMTTTVIPEHSEVINGDWSLIECTFKIQDPSNTVSIVSIGKDNSKAPLYVDNLLIKEKGVDVFKEETDGSLFYNNHRIQNDGIY